jgi:subtilase family serine protease
MDFNPTQFRHAYGFDRVGFLDSAHNYVPGDGRGTTIAIVDAYDDPYIDSDLYVFDHDFGIAAPPSFRKVNQTGGTNYPPPSRGWATEIALDVEYAHAMAPGANILLVEANDSNSSNLETAVQYAANQPGVVAVSNSYGGGEYSGETTHDSVYTHAGVTYLSATGDNGAPGQYQAYSPNMVAVGGTFLSVDSSNNWSGETGWGGSGGGISQYETQPTYQRGVVTQSTTRRTIPDLSFDAGNATLNDTYGGSGFYGQGGTSLSCPIAAALVAIVNQGRSYLNGLSSYSGASYLNALYHLADNAFHDITSGNNGFAAGPGYDLVTGRGTPIVPRFVAGMTGDPVYDPTTGKLLIVGGGRNSNDTITLNTSGSLFQVSFNLGNPVPGNGYGSSYTKNYTIGSFNSIEVDTTNGGFSSSVAVSRTPNVPLTIVGDGRVYVYLGTGGNAQGVLGSVTLAGASNFTYLTVDDSSDPATHFVTVNDAGTNQGVITGLTPSPIYYAYDHTGQVSLDTGTGTNTTNVLATGAGTLFVLSGASNATLVNVGNGHVQSIRNGVIVASHSASALVVDDSADSGSHNVTIGTDPANSNDGTIDGLITPTGPSISFQYTGTNSVTLKTGTGTEVINVKVVAKPLTLYGNSNATTVNVGNNNSMAGITSAFTVHNSSYYTALNLNDSADTANRTITLNATGVTGLSSGAISFLANDLKALTINGGSGNNTYTVSGTPVSAPVTLDAGTGNDTVNVQATSSPLAVNGSGGGGNDVVNLGNSSNSIVGITGAVTLSNPSRFNVSVRDDGDAANRTLTIGPGGVSGLAPINFTSASVDGLTVYGGSGNNTYTVSATPASRIVILYPGTGANTVNVQATSTVLSVRAPTGTSHVLNLGNNNSVTGITGTVVLDSDSHFQVNVNDAADTTNRAVTIYNFGIVGLAPAQLQMYSYSVTALTINGGTGTNTYTVSATPASTSMTLNAGSGTDTVNVQATTVPLTVNGSGGGGNDVVNLGNGNSLAGITAPVTLANPSRFHLNVNDAADGANRTASIGAGGITGLSPAAINFSSASVNVLAVNAGTGISTYTVSATPASRVMTLSNAAGTVTVNVLATSVPLAVNSSGGGGNDVVNLGSGNSLAGITADVTLANASRFSVNVNDAADTTNRTATIDLSGITGLSPAAINFSFASVNVLTVNGGSGNNTYTVNGTPAFTSMTLNTGSGTDTVNVQGTSVSLTVNGSGGGGNDVVNLGNGNSLAGITAVTLANASRFHLNVNDAADTASRTASIGAAGITGLAPAAINFSSASVNVLTVNGGTGTSTYTITDTPASQGVTLNTGLGGNTVNVQATSAPLTVNTGSYDVVYLTGSGNTLDSIAAVAVNDPTGTSAVTLDDSGYGGGDDYVVTGWTVTTARSATFSLTYGGIGSLELDGGAASSYFDIDSTSVATTVNAGLGSNIFHVSPFTQYLAASLGGPLTLNGGGGDILEFFDGNDSNPETFSFDSVPMSLTLGSTGTDVTDFTGMGGGVYVVTNGFSTPDDQSGTVVFDPSGGPPSAGGTGPSVHSGAARPPLDDGGRALVSAAAAEVGGGSHGPVSAFFGHPVKVALHADLIDQLFSW